MSNGGGKEPQIFDSITMLNNGGGLRPDDFVSPTGKQKPAGNSDQEITPINFEAAIPWLIVAIIVVAAVDIAIKRLKGKK